ncbi:MAG: dihydroorotate dehydrogenase electron transfer subunit [Prevotella sp.]|nr:dihydroorotate dehydrogenase electron transfer subunit [Prevotella sp.]
MRKSLLDLTVSGIERVHERYVLIRLTDSSPLPAMLPGQFVEVRVDNEPSTFLRRPISINYVDRDRNELWLLVATVGAGTRRIASLRPGDRLNCLLPLGNGFSPAESGQRVLLVGGGVGVAPLLYQGKVLSERGVHATFLLGARTSHDLLLLDLFSQYGPVETTTEDGSHGEKGFVTDHSLLTGASFDLIQTCGPTPMMKSVARYAHQHAIACEASLENLMACGLGACLCCVEKTTEGNVCVCKEGPVFNINRLLWQI